MKRIITVSREFGSGGHAIAELMARELDIPVYDKEIIEQAAERSGLSEDFISENEQNLASEWLHALSRGSRYTSPSVITLADRVFLAQRNAIISLAQKGPCIIVGRCADYILTHCDEVERGDVLNIFVYAPADFKVQWAVEQRSFNPRTAGCDIRLIDKRRANHYNAFTEQTWGARENYNLLVDSAVLGFEGTAAQLVSFAARTD